MKFAVCVNRLIYKGFGVSIGAIFILHLELQGTTRKFSSENLESQNLNKLAISLKLDLQHCPLIDGKFIKRYNLSIILKKCVENRAFLEFFSKGTFQ